MTDHTEDDVDRRAELLEVLRDAWPSGLTFEDLEVELCERLDFDHDVDPAVLLDHDLGALEAAGLVTVDSGEWTLATDPDDGLDRGSTHELAERSFRRSDVACPRTFLGAPQATGTGGR